MIPIPEMKNIDTAFGNIKHLPPMKDIPKEFIHGNTKWNKAQQDWFFKGITTDQLVPKDGVDLNKAVKALSAIQRSFEPSHEHKEAGVAYLMSEWFEDYISKEEKK